jgi:hypothetical protein
LTLAGLAAVKPSTWLQNMHVSLLDGITTLPDGSVLYASGGPSGCGLGTAGSGPTPEVWVGALRAQAAYETRLTAAISSATSTTAIAVTTTANFPASGSFEVSDGTNTEVIAYTGVTASVTGGAVTGATFTGITRAQNGTTGAAFAAGSAVRGGVTSLSAALTASATTASVFSTANLPSTGLVQFISGELATYTGKTATSLTGLTRGAKGTVAAAQAVNSTVKLTRTCTSGTSGTNLIDTAMGLRSGSTASITAVTGSGATRTMTVTGMANLVPSDVGSFFLFGLATNKSTVNAGTTSVTFGTPSATTGGQLISGLTAATFSTTGQVGDLLSISGATNAANNGVFVITAVNSATTCTIANPAGIAEGPTASVVWAELGCQSPDTGNNGHLKMVTYVSATSATFLNPQALVENTGAIYWQESYRGCSVRFLSGGTTGVIGDGLVEHGVLATGTLTVVPKANLVDNDRFTMNDGTNPAITFEYKVTGGFSPVAGRVTIDISAIADVTAAGVAVQTANTINANAPNAGSTPLRVRAAANHVNLATSTQTSVVNVSLMLPNGAGTTITETVAHASFTVTGFSGGVGTPTTTVTFQPNVSPAPASGDAYVIQKAGSIFQSSGQVAFSSAAGPFGMTGIKFQGTSTSFGFYFVNEGSVSWSQCEIDAGGGQWHGAGSSAPSALPSPLRDVSLWVADSSSPFLGTKHCLHFHTGNLVIAGTASLASPLMTTGARVVMLGKGSPITDSRRTTFSLGADFSNPPVLWGGGESIFNTNSWTIRGNCLTTDAGAIVVDGGSSAFLAVSGGIFNCYGYGVVVRGGSAVRMALVPGSGNTRAGWLADRGGLMRIDAGSTTTALTGNGGDAEFDHLPSPNYLTYASLRAVNPTPGLMRTAANVTGHNGVGACTATGLKVGDVVLGVNFAKVPTAAAATQAGLTAFESVITVADQIQQSGAANLSADVFDVLVNGVSTRAGYSDPYGNRCDIG